MNFNQIRHLIKLDIKKDIPNQDDKQFFIKWDIVC